MNSLPQGKTWRDYEPPLIPVYYVEYEALKDMLEKNFRSISIQGLELMLDYFNEYEMYEKSHIVFLALEEWREKGDSPENLPGLTLV